MVAPFNPDQKKQCNKVMADINKIQHMISTVQERMQKEAKNEEKLADGHKVCLEVMALISKMNEANDLVHLVEVTERLGELC